MEKDFFKDRPTESTLHKSIQIGSEVYICEKQMQRYAETLDDLTRVTVEEILTSQAIHPRGQKVRGLQYIIDEHHQRVPFRKKIGRVVYLCEGNQILTKDGWKPIESFR